MRKNIDDMNVLHDALRASMKGSAWKREPQAFDHDWLAELSKLKKELQTQTYKTSKGSEFTLNERGKVRHIHGKRMRDRVVRHALCDEIIGPSIKPYLIHNNGASQKGKGLSFARKQFEKDLHNYFLKHGNNEGYIVFGDFSKFYDNIQHAKIKELLYPKIPAETHWLVAENLHNMEIDMSYMTDEEYAVCLDRKFNSVEYYESIPKAARTGEKMMQKSVDIGDQLSQDLGVFFPYRIDNYAKIVRGLRYYGRYMDDIYFLCETREEAASVILGLKEQAEKLGLFINEKKTHIAKLSDTYKYLQIKYSLTESGKVIRRINPKTVTRERRKLKAYKRMLDKGIVPLRDIEQAYKSWMGAYAKLMSKIQARNMKGLYKSLFGKEISWSKSYSRMERKSQRNGTGAAISLTKSRHSRKTCQSSQ